MLVNLHVKNMALIEEAEIDLKNGLNIFTGETGAGKSIMLGSINACIGGKISTDIIRKGADYALVELVFSVEDADILDKLKTLDIAELDNKEVIITRKIMPSRSQFKINGETVTVSTIKEVAKLLIDIHGQHDHQSLLDEHKHLEIVDRFLDKEALTVKKDLSNLVDEYNSLLEEYKKFDIDEEQRNREISFLKYEIDEIENASLKENEDEDLEILFSRMNNVSSIMSEINMVNALLFENGDSNAKNAISKSIKQLSNILKYDDKLSDMYEQLMSIETLLNDFYGELTHYMDSMEFDDETFEITSKRLDLINTLKMKYGSDIQEILKYLETRKEKISEYENFDENKIKIETQLKALKKDILNLCSELSSYRKKAATFLEEKIIDALKELNFLDVKFKVCIEENKNFTANGFDSASFLISTNPGEELKPLSKIASGGEMSRIMLAIKEIIANNDEIDCLIFDEIDTGISGKTAQLVANKMHKIALTHQVLCITHLPQIASMADEHFMIEKTAENNSTTTKIYKLDENASILELARLLGGNTITDSVIATAKELKANASI